MADCARLAPAGPATFCHAMRSTRERSVQRNKKKIEKMKNTKANKAKMAGN